MAGAAAAAAWSRGLTGTVCRRQELQRRQEYQQEVQEMRRRVMGRPLLLEQVAQVTTQVRTHIAQRRLNYGTTAQDRLEV